MSEFEANSISVYHKQDDSWYGKIYSQASSKVDESEVSALIEACKAHTRKGCLAEGPRIIHLPSGYYMQNGAGFNFCTGERDIGYTALGPETVEMIRNYDKFFFWRRLGRLLAKKLRRLKWNVKYGWFSHLKLLRKQREEIKALRESGKEAPEAAAYPESENPIYIRFWKWLWNRVLYYCGR